MKRRGVVTRRDTRITSQRTVDGDILVGVGRGFSGAGEILYRIESEKLAGACEDRKELAVIVNNLGLLVLAQMCGFNLAEKLEELPKALAKWGHITLPEKPQPTLEEALAIAQATVKALEGNQVTATDGPSPHLDHGRGTEADGPDEPDCPCRGPGPDQTVCAAAGCGFCLAAEESQ